MQRMKITAGLGGVAHYPTLVEAGADECFMGFVPIDYLEKYTNIAPINRREVLLQDIQAGSMVEMRHLAAMKRDLGVPVALTFNSPVYLPSQHSYLLNLFDALGEIGFEDVIIADPALLLKLRDAHYAGRVHISGEVGLFNAEAMRLWAGKPVSRWIFPRKVQPSEMAECIRSLPEYEFEAFALNELCHFSGAFCMSFHCDEFSHACHVPYLPIGPDCARVQECDPPLSPEAFGSSGCALCALPALQCAGVTHLKIVGRGAKVDLMARDIRILRSACEAVAQGQTELHRFLPDGICSSLCYY